MLAAPDPNADATTRPAVIVVLLPRARGGPLVRSIDDAAAQRDVDVELLGPSADPRVRTLDVAVSAHPADVLDAALVAAHGGDWVAFLEGGDRWHPEHLTTAIGRATHASAQWAHGAAVLLGAAGEVAGQRGPAPTRCLRARLRHADVIGGASSVVCRRGLLERRRPFDRRLSALVLWSAWIALAEEQSAGCTEALVAERWDEDRAVLDARTAMRDMRVMLSEGSLHPAACGRLARRYEQLGHGRGAARLHLLAATTGRHPRGVLRAARALRARGQTTRAVGAPAWLAAPSPAPG
jgi:hypothetical protein